MPPSQFEDWLDAVWQEAAENICDKFPDVEQIVKLSRIEADFRREILIRTEAVERLLSPEGSEATVAAVMKATAQYANNPHVCGRDVMSQIGTKNLTPDEIVKHSVRYDKSWSLWIAHLDNVQILRHARHVLRMWRELRNNTL